MFGELGQEPLLDRGRERGAAVAHAEQRAGVVAAALELLDQRPGDGVAHDGEGAAPLALDRLPRLGGIEPAGVRREHERVPVVEADERHPLGGPVHQRRQDEEPQRLGERRRRGGHVVVVRHRLAGQDVPPAHGRHVDVVLAPQHALRHPGRAARVEDVEVVGRRRRRRRPGGGVDGRERGLVLDGPGQQVVPGVVGHLDQHLQRGEAVEEGGQRGGEGVVVDEGPAAGVVEQVEQLVLDVAVVDVERRHPGPEGAEHGLQVLVAVVEVDAQVVLAGLVAGEPVPLGVGAQAPGPQIGGQAAAAVRQVGEGQADVAPDQRGAVGVDRGHRVEHLGQGELHLAHVPSPSDAVSDDTSVRGGRDREPAVPGSALAAHRLGEELAGDEAGPPDETEDGAERRRDVGPLEAGEHGEHVPQREHAEHAGGDDRQVGQVRQRGICGSLRMARMPKAMASRARSRPKLA